jgi:5'-methylthioadenosine phosphorylase
MKIGLLGGYGLQELLENSVISEQEAIFDDEKIHGKFPKFYVFQGEIEGKKVVIIPRHGVSHNIPPHKVPFKSIITRFVELGVDKIITINSVGILNTKYKKPSFFIISDFVSMGKEVTFFDLFEDEAHHTNMSRPYDEEMNKIIEDVMKNLGLTFYRDVVYVNSHGPRLETPSEIKRKYAPLGDIIGMTNAYEVILANEKNMPISSIGIGVNYAEGLGERADFNEMKVMMKKMQSDIHRVLKEVIKRL